MRRLCALILLVCLVQGSHAQPASYLTHCLSQGMKLSEVVSQAVSFAKLMSKESSAYKLSISQDASCTFESEAEILFLQFGPLAREMVIFKARSTGSLELPGRLVGHYMDSLLTADPGATLVVNGSGLDAMKVKEIVFAEVMSERLNLPAMIDKSIVPNYTANEVHAEAILESIPAGRPFTMNVYPVSRRAHMFVCIKDDDGSLLVLDNQKYIRLSPDGGRKYTERLSEYLKEGTQAKADFQQGVADWQAIECHYASEYKMPGRCSE